MPVAIARIVPMETFENEQFLLQDIELQMARGSFESGFSDRQSVLSDIGPKTGFLQRDRA